MTRKFIRKCAVLAFIGILPLLFSMCGGSDYSTGCASSSFPQVMTVPDTTAPDIPQNLRLVAAGSTEVSLAWDPAYDNVAVKGYNVYRNGSLVKYTLQTTLLNGGLQLGVQYCYAVSAVDSSNNHSAKSDPLCVTTQQNLIAPSTPAHLSAASDAPTQSTLSWEPSSDNLSVAGYNIYRNGAYLAAVTTPWSIDSTLTAGTPYCYTVAAYDRDGNLSAMSNTACVTPSSSWTTSVVDTGGAGWSSSLARDPEGRLYIGYLRCTLLYGYYNCSLKYARNSSGQWTVHDIAPNETVSQNGVSLAVDSAGHAHLSYQTDWSATDQGLKYMTNVSGQWATENLDQYGSIPSMAVDAADAVHIAYFDFQNRQLKYVTNTSGTWSRTVLDSWDSQLWISPALALDTGGHAHISYYDSYNHCVKYANNASGTWEIYSADTWTGSAILLTAVRSDIAVDPAGRAHISYYDYFHEILRYATNSSGTWTGATVDSSPQAGVSNSIAIDSAGRVHISYHDGTYGDLKYALYSSGAWQLYDLDNIGTVGSYAAMVIDPADTVHISYFDFTNGNLKYITDK